MEPALMLNWTLKPSYEPLRGNNDAASPRHAYAE
jgi:hypothetical protein